MSKAQKTAWLDFINEPQELENPESWYMRGLQYHSAAKLLLGLFLNEVKDGVKINDRLAEIINAFNTVPYLVSISLELYMKGYLISQGETVQDVVKYKHDLKGLRQKCIEHDQLFNQPSIKLISDRLVEQVLQRGGIRYPNKRNAPIYQEDFIEALEIARKKLQSKLTKDKL